MHAGRSVSACPRMQPLYPAPEVAAAACHTARLKRGIGEAAATGQTIDKAWVYRRRQLRRAASGAARRSWQVFLGSTPQVRAHTEFEQSQPLTSCPGIDQCSGNTLQWGKEDGRMKEMLGQRIRRLREAKKLGLRETAKKVEISPTYLSRIETNEERTPPGEEVLQRLAALLGDDVDALMSLAGRVPTDVKEFITTEPGMPQFLRTVREQGYTAEELERLLLKGRGKGR